MRLARVARGPAPDPLVALISIMFILLASILMIGAFSGTSASPSAAPQGRTDAGMTNSALRLSIGSGGQLWLNGQVVSRPAALITIRAQIRARPDLSVRIDASRTLTMRDLLPMITDIEALGVRDIALIVAPGSD